ncbi:hypothetical protein JVU11DRAFT_4778 [Chiua virens]|nr:hypothetical protein JVU11DRAFT_4778 [Chiua virens]
MVVLFSVIVLAASARLLSQVQEHGGITTTFSILGVAAATTSVVSLLVMLIVDVIRPGSFVCMIAIEVTWLFVLCCLWVGTGTETYLNYVAIFPLGCDMNYYLNCTHAMYAYSAVLDHPVLAMHYGWCRNTQAIEVFSFLSFITICLYVVPLCIAAVAASMRGQSVWLSTIREAYGPLSELDSMQYPMKVYNVSVRPPPPAYHIGVPLQTLYPGGLPGKFMV